MNRLLFNSIAAWLCIADSAQAAFPSFDITVSAGKHERRNVPVRVQLPPGQLKADQIGSVTLAGSDGKSIPAQWTKPGIFGSTGSELHFILPHFKAGESVRLTAKFSVESPRAGDAFAWDDHPPKYTALCFSLRPVTTYHYERLDESTPESRVRTYKVFHHLYSPERRTNRHQRSQ